MPPICHDHILDVHIVISVDCLLWEQDVLDLQLMQNKVEVIDKVKEED